MKYAITLLVFSTIYSNSLKAETADQEYRTLCSYDSKWCGKLKNSDGTYVRPKKEIVRLLKELAPIIEKHAATLGVDPRAVAGAIMAENSLNVSISDDVQDLLVKIGVANKGEILGKKFTYGLGQLNFQAAREAENYAAKLEKRAPLSDSALSDALLVPEKAVYYVAAVIRKVQDVYKEKGLDISGKPEILTTLYNLGRADSKADEAKYKGVEPRPNYFGFFVKKYANELSFLSRPAEKKKVVNAEVKSAEKSAAKFKWRKSAPATVRAEDTKKLKLAFTKSMPLYTSPPVCATSKDYGSTNLKSKYESMKNFAVSSIVDKEKTFEVLAPTIDCDANAWELIKTSTGEIGWIKHDDLEKNTAKILITEPKCSFKPDLKCIAQFKSELGENLIDPAKSKNEFFMKPFSTSGNASFKVADWECRAKEDKEDSGLYSNSNWSGSAYYSSYNNGGGGGTGFSMPARKIGPPVYSDEELQQAQNKIDNKLKELETFYKAPLDSPKNPYSITTLPFLKSGLKRCVDKQAFKLDNCKMDLKNLDLFLKDIEAKSKITTEDLGYVNHNSILLSYGLPYVSKADYKAAIASGTMNYGFGGYGAMGGGIGYAFMGLPSQYLFREGEENLWTSDDVEKALKECLDSINTLQLKVSNDSKLSGQDSSAMVAALDTIRSGFSAGVGSSFKRFLAMPKAEQAKAWPLVQPEFVQTAKLCLSLNETYKLKSLNDYKTPVTQNYTCFYKNLDVLESGASLMLKDLVNETMYTPAGIQQLNSYFQMAFGQNAVNLLNPPTAPVNPVASTNGISNEVKQLSANFCPNKTAEQIEDIVKKYPCVNKIYVPERWLLNRLNELGDKVIYKPFAEDDRYSFDVEKKTCR